MSDTRRAAPVLLVEDDDNDIVLIQREMHKAGARVDLHVVRDGEQAIMYLEGVGPFADRSRYPLPELMLLDLKLPRKSGHEVLEWVRTSERLKELPIAVLTSSMEPEGVSKAYDLGARSCLLKPLTDQALTALLRELDMFEPPTNEDAGEASQ